MGRERERKKAKEREKEKEKEKSKYSVYYRFLLQITPVKPEFSHGVRAGLEAGRTGCFTLVALPVQKAHTHTHTRTRALSWGAKRQSPAVPDIVIYATKLHGARGNEIVWKLTASECFKQMFASAVPLEEPVCNSRK